MGKIQGMDNLLTYLNEAGYPMTEQQIKLFLKQRNIPHSRPFGNLLVFDSKHIDWWIAERRRAEDLIK